MGHGAASSIGAKGLDRRHSAMGDFCVLGWSHHWHSCHDGRLIRILAHTTFALVCIGFKLKVNGITEIHNNFVGFLQG